MINSFILPSIVFIVMIGTYWLLSKTQGRSSLRQRLRFSQKTAPHLGGPDARKSKQKKAVLQADLIEKFKKKNKQTIVDFRMRFERCGWNPDTAAILVPFYKIFSVIVFFCIFFFINNFSNAFSDLEPLVRHLILALMLFIGYRSFDYLTDFKIARRCDTIIKDVPMAIDLLVVCVRGGLSFDNALDRISQEVIHTNPDLARELTITSAELGILPERKLAYKNLAKRVDADIMRTLTTSLIQSEEQGVAIGKTLMFLSQETSKQRLMMIERKAAKLPSKLTVPVVLLSLPAILMIILGPTIAAILESDLFSAP